ncbi:TPA: hypothetical protein N0F65_006855 [Lagenidium giganteum]|uniref:Uncharacterized protein n=1 Tax=Lagenidium giganteum TaxID=4803 RepID=A0AAV2YIJ9_9STRA|nr:TPA: hypothetical protein N0F65_006855 [Lagenidium giganteum]
MSEEAMAKFVVEFDPLAMIEAEYAAVLAQSKQPVRKRSSAEEPQQDGDDDENNEEESDSEDDQIEANYSLLPSSPFGSDDEGDNNEEEERLEAVKAPQPSAPSIVVPPIEESKRNAIMDAMRGVQLKPPSWARAKHIPDSELVAMVQEQLHIRTSDHYQ